MSNGLPLPPPPPPSNRGKNNEGEKDSLLDEDASSVLGLNGRRHNSSGTVRSAKSLGLVFVIIFGLGLALLFVFFRDTEAEATCPGNLIVMDCPCFTQCLVGFETVPVTCPSQGECHPGCGCPSDKPFLTDSHTCSASCLEASRGNPRDFTDCPEVKVAPLLENEVLFQMKDTETFHFRISPTFPCVSAPGKKQVDVLVHFTLLVKGVDCNYQLKEYFVSYQKRKRLTMTGVIACLNMNSNDFDESIRGAWFFHVARLTNLGEDTEIDYEVGVRMKTAKKSATRKFVAPLSSGSNHLERPVLVLGDTSTAGAKLVAKSIAELGVDSGYSLAIHVGDASYATNKGDCYDDKGNDPTGRCGFKCDGVECHGADKIQKQEMLDLYSWAKVLDAELAGKVAWVSTMGNHDNDLPWFLTYRPLVVAAVPDVEQKYLSWEPKNEAFISPSASNALKQADAMGFMKSPHFFSFNHGLMHVISIGTEDNPINAYETWNGEPFTDEQKQRFEDHYGKNSKQYTWLEQDLKRADAQRKVVPWIVIYTHRPMYHTARHHEWCAKGGDWYGCMFLQTYEPLLKKYRVNLFITGHSHHYQRSLPMYDGKVTPDGTVHLIVGVGGYEVVGEHWVANPKWMASRQGTKLGYARFWVKNATSIYWEHISAELGTVLDSAWFTNYHVAEDDE